MGILASLQLREKAKCVGQTLKPREEVQMKQTCGGLVSAGWFLGSETWGKNVLAPVILPVLT